MLNRTQHRAGAWLADILWPNLCDCCGCRIPFDLLICDKCAEQLGMQRVTAAQWEKRSGEMQWDGGAAAFSYRGTARNGVLAMKRGRRGFCRYAAGILAEQIAAELTDAAISCVTWVPMNDSRRRMQGFSHEENLGKAVAAALHLPVRGDLLRARPVTVQQHQLSAAERARNVKRFEPRRNRIDGQNVLLVDDILTTGATLNYCTELLRSIGAAKVYAAAACAVLPEENDAGKQGDTSGAPK